MAIIAFRTACRVSARSFFPLRLCQEFRLTSVAAVQKLSEAEDVFTHRTHDSCTSTSADRWRGRGSMPEWKRFCSRDLGITNSMISKASRLVLNKLRRKGHDVYLVGGCVRDLVLKRTPKDFDIITSAGLKEVKRTFSHCLIIGKRFPICHVHIDDNLVEVSSFSTHLEVHDRGLNYADEAHKGCSKNDYIRWNNCLHRDFTINGLMFDPFANIIYDYMGGMEDIGKTKVRTMIPARASFQEDCARILRAVRIAARLGFQVSKDIAQSVVTLASSVLRLDKGRILMEVNYLLAFGSAEASLRLLWKFGLLELLLPIQAAYFASHGFRRSDKGTNLLLSLFTGLDRLLAPDRPCHSSLWVGILAFHQALLSKGRGPLAIATFCFAINNGGDVVEAVAIATRMLYPHDQRFPEISESLDVDPSALQGEVVDLAASVTFALSLMRDYKFVSRAMCEYPEAPQSDTVFIPLGLYLKIRMIFDCITEHEGLFEHRQGRIIDYEMLRLGSLSEVQHVLARVIFDTVFPFNS